MWLKERNILSMLLFAWLSAILLSPSSASASSSCLSLLGFPQNFISQSLLLAKAEPIQNFTENVPRMLDRRIARVLFSKNIKSSDLPYTSGVRPPISLSAPTLLARTQELESVRDLRVTNILIGSDVKGSMYSLVRLGFLSNGRPVAVKTIFKSNFEKIRNEVRGAIVLSDLGIFPNYHGLWSEGQDISIVTDIVPGELLYKPSKPSLIEIQQLVQVFTRLTAVGIFKLPEQETVLQYIRGNDHLIQVIDADGFYERLADSHPSLISKLDRLGHFSVEDLQPKKFSEYDYIGYDWGHILAQYIESADVSTAMKVLSDLKKQGGPLWEKTMDRLGDDLTFEKVSFPRRVAKFIADN